MAALAGGTTNAEVAELWFIGEATVKSHVSSILTKLGLRDRAQVVVFSYVSGLVEAGQRDIGFQYTNPGPTASYGSSGARGLGVRRESECSPGRRIVAGVRRRDVERWVQS